VGIQRDKAKPPPFQEPFSADFPRIEDVASSARLVSPPPMGILPKPLARQPKEIPVPERRPEIPTPERKLERAERVENVNVVFIVNCAPALPAPGPLTRRPKGKRRFRKSSAGNRPSRNRPSGNNSRKNSPSRSSWKRETAASARALCRSKMLPSKSRRSIFGRVRLRRFKFRRLRFRRFRFRPSKSRPFR